MKTFPLARLAFVALLALAGAGCSADNGDAGAPGKSVHPTADNIPVITEERHLFGHEEDTFIDLSAYPSRSIGIENGPPEEVIGYIRDVATGAQGEILLLDASLRSPTLELRAYDQRGVADYTIGGAGAGPGEFRQPTSLDYAPGSSLLGVLDWGRVHVFRRRASGYELASSFQATGYSDICIIGERVFIHGLSGSKDGVIHRYTLGGEYEFSFQDPYNHPEFIARWEMHGRAKLACNEQSGVVLSLMATIPAVTGYSANGEVLWRIGFPDFEPQQLIVDVMEGATDPRSRSVAWMRDPDRSEFTSAMVDGPDHFVVQYRTEGTTPGVEGARWHLFRIHAALGRGTYLGWTDKVVLAVDSSRVVAQANEKFPQLIVYDTGAFRKPAAAH